MRFLVARKRRASRVESCFAVRFEMTQKGAVRASDLPPKSGKSQPDGGNNMLFERVFVHFESDFDVNKSKRWYLAFYF